MPQARNFDGYPILRPDPMPCVHVRIVESGRGGIGDPGLPGVPPAGINAASVLTASASAACPSRSSTCKAWRDEERRRSRLDGGCTNLGNGLVRCPGDGFRLRGAPVSAALRGLPPDRDHRERRRTLPAGRGRPLCRQRRGLQLLARPVGSGITWMPETLETCLANPTAMVRGTRMVQRFHNTDERRAIFAFLRSRSRGAKACLAPSCRFRPTAWRVCGFVCPMTVAGKQLKALDGASVS
jgi:hypothetical protein